MRMGLLVAVVAFVAALAGCVSGKAVDSTKAMDYVTRGESQVTYTVIPGAIAGMPDNAIAIPTVPGKNAKFRSYYPDGAPQFELDTDRGGVLAALLGSGGIAGIDLAKFAEDEARREWWSRERAALFSELRSYVGLFMQYKRDNPETPTPSKADKLAENVERLLNALQGAKLTPDEKPKP